MTHRYSARTDAVTQEALLLLPVASGMMYNFYTSKTGFHPIYHAPYNILTI